MVHSLIETSETGKMRVYWKKGTKKSDLTFWTSKNPKNLKMDIFKMSKMHFWLFFSSSFSACFQNTPHVVAWKLRKIWKPPLHAFFRHFRNDQIWRLFRYHFKSRQKSPKVAKNKLTENKWRDVLRDTIRNVWIKCPT